MPAHTDLQAWLDVDAARHPPLVTAYVQSPTSQPILYTITVTQRGPGHSANMAQSGSMTVQEGAATPLSKFSISASPAHQCQIELVLKAEGQPQSTYPFECPR